MLYRFRTRVSRKFGSTNAHIKVLLGLVFWCCVFFSKLSKVLIFAQPQYSCVYTTVLEHLQKLYCTLHIDARAESIFLYQIFAMLDTRVRDSPETVYHLSRWKTRKPAHLRLCNKNRIRKSSPLSQPEPYPVITSTSRNTEGMWLLWQSRYITDLHVQLCGDLGKTPLLLPALLQLFQRNCSSALTGAERTHSTAALN